MLNEISVIFLELFKSAMRFRCRHPGHIFRLTSRSIPIFISPIILILIVPIDNINILTINPKNLTLIIFKLPNKLSQPPILLL